MQVLKRILPHAWILVLLIAALTRWWALDAVPPGIKYDTTSSGVYALNIVSNGSRPFYINPSGAPEPLMVYLQAIAIYFFGANIFTLRFLSAATGILVVALLYALAKETTHDSRIALVAAFALAVAVEPINVTRTGLRATLTPLLVTAWLLWFWRGWRHRRLRDFVIAGVILGLGMYTYIATLAIWLIAAGWWAHQFLFARATWRQRFWQIAGMIVVAVILLLPRLIFQITFASAALNRTGEVSIFQNPAIKTIGLGGVIAERLLAYALMFGISWQGELYNVLHQPLLDPFLFGCFLLGGLLCLTRLRRIQWAWATLTLGVMLLPDLLGANEPTPNELRTIGIIPPTFFLVGVGATLVCDFVSQRIRWRAVGTGLLLLAFAISAIVGLQAYLGDFATAAQAGPDEDYNRTEIAEAEWITHHDEPVFLPLNEYARSPVHFLVGGRAAQLQSAIQADGSFDSQALPDRAWILFPIEVNLRPRTEGSAYVDDPARFALVENNHVFIMSPAGNLVKTALSDRVPSEQILDSVGQVVANAYLVDAPANLFRFESPPRQLPLAQFSQGITLIGGTLDNTHTQVGESIGVSLFWHTTRPLNDDYAIFAHVLDINENVLVSTDVIPALGAYPTYLWKTGEIVGTRHELKIPQHAQEGEYTIEVGMYNVLNQNRLEVLDANGKPIDSRVIIGTVKVTPAIPVNYNPSHPQRVDIAGEIALLGFDIPAQVKPGDEATITLYWQSLAKLSTDYTVFVHLLDSNGQIVAQVDHQSQDGQFPTSIWDVGDQIRDDFSLSIPTDLAPGLYPLEIGWYDLKTGKRLALSSGANSILLNAPLAIGN